MKKVNEKQKRKEMNWLAHRALLLLNQVEHFVFQMVVLRTRIREHVDERGRKRDFQGFLDAWNNFNNLQTIFNETFGSDAGRIRQAVDETIVMVETKKEPGAIKKSLSFLLDIVGNVGSNVIATGIISIIKGMQAINE